MGVANMSSILALIPAKRHSAGVPDKNWKPIAPDGRSCLDLAVSVAEAVADRVVLSSDATLETAMAGTVISRRPGLPDTMRDVVADALSQVAGPDDEVVVLLQPTSPLRTVDTVSRAIQMLRDDPTADSVVSVSSTTPMEPT